ncbi:MAG: DNA-deoxyinosine glycosylase, partial [Christensenellaceae bacterium]
LTPIFSAAKLKGILLNGSKAYDLFEKHYASVGIPFYKMPSTSPANPRYEQQVWRNTLDELFRSDR